MVSGQVSDLVWLGEKPYDPTTGEGAVGVELAGTAVSSSGVTGTIAYAHQQVSFNGPLFPLVASYQELFISDYTV